MLCTIDHNGGVLLGNLLSADQSMHKYGDCFPSKVIFFGSRDLGFRKRKIRMKTDKHPLTITLTRCYGKA